MKDFIKELKAANEKFQKEKKEGRCDFNIFEALKVEMKENYHSAFLAYLLDSNKGHYQTIFLEKFLERIAKESTPFKTPASENCESITTESSTHQNRRIDILIKFNNGYHIIIENKINARDQVAQIRDYVESLHKQGVKAKQILVIYLTKDNVKPSGNSLCKWEIQKHEIVDSSGTPKAYYLGISYEWIKEWLEKDCLKSIEKEGSRSINGKTKAENGLNKIILCLRQYIEILNSHILKTSNKKETKEYILDCVMQNADFTNKALEILSKDKQDNKEQQECYEILKEHKNAIQDSILQDFYNAVECYCRDKESLKIGGTIWYAENYENGILFYKKADKDKAEGGREMVYLFFAIKGETSACFTADAYGAKELDGKDFINKAFEYGEYFKKEAKDAGLNSYKPYLKDYKTFQPDNILIKNEIELCKWIYSHAQDKDTKEKVLSKAIKEFMPLFREFATKPLIKEYVRKYSKLFND
ncbi:PDDEXK-like family protein [Helicobacter bilis]|uniref:PDDEXK-like family protein n=1 Tax=Helicobacter bilis TaxID=37372 RepID=UPI000CF1912F|nr:PD-(D/E)XK nuclease family protein [Helicobacter bilis]